MTAERAMADELESIADEELARYPSSARIVRNAAKMLRAYVMDAAKYRVLREKGICDGTVHFRITDEMDSAIDAAMRECEGSESA